MSKTKTKTENVIEEKLCHTGHICNHNKTKCPKCEFKVCINMLDLYSAICLYCDFIIEVKL